VREVAGRQSVVGQQAEATSATDICKADLRLTISHFLQNVNMSILRGKYGFRPGDRTHYGLDVNQENLPKMDRESDLLLVAKTVVDGDAKRLEAGGTPILMPSSGKSPVCLRSFPNSSKPASNWSPPSTRRAPMSPGCVTMWRIW